MSKTDLQIQENLATWLSPFFDDDTKKTIKQLQSTNPEELNDSFYKKHLPKLENLDLITCREDLFSELITKSFNLKSFHICDPTLLLDVQHYEKVDNDHKDVLPPHPSPNLSVPTSQVPAQYLVHANWDLALPQSIGGSE